MQATFTSLGTPPGQYAIEITGSAGGYTANALVELTIVTKQTPEVTLSISAGPENGGTTSPSPGNYSISQGVTKVVTAIPWSGWRLDQWLVNGTPSGNGSLIEVEMSANVLVSAVFAPGEAATTSSTVSFSNAGYSGLTISVDGQSYPLPASFSWPIGSEHKVTATSLALDGNLSRETFMGWGGAQVSTNPTMRLDVEGSSNYYPIYQSEYLVPFVFSDCNGKSLAAQGVTIEESGGTPVSLGSNLRTWLTAGPVYRVVAATWNAISFSSSQLGSVQFVVTGPNTVALVLPVCNLNVRVSDLFGLPVSGAQVFLQFGDSPQFYAKTNSQGIAEFPQVPEGPYSGDIYYMGTSSQITANSATGNQLLVTVALSYPLFLSGIAFGVVFVGAFVLRRKRHKSQKAEIVFFS